MSSITGANAINVGMNGTFGRAFQRNWDLAPVSYRFNNGIPNQITQRSLSDEWLFDVEPMLGVSARDRLTVDRLTLNCGAALGSVQEQLPGAERGTDRDVTARRARIMVVSGIGN